MTTADALLQGPFPIGDRSTAPHAEPQNERADTGQNYGVRPLFAARVLPHGRRKRSFSGHWPIRRILVVLMALAGSGVLLYPMAAAWFSDRVHAGQVTAYVESVGALTTAEQAEMLAEAHAYNDALPDGPLRDPYTFNANGVVTEVGDGVAAYRSTLTVGAGGMMGVVEIPEIGVDLPVYHGTSDATLAKGIGHMYGSSLPVGGEGTHAVITGHSGYVNSTLFNDLAQMHLGDTFTIKVLNEVLTYRVDHIVTVLPDDSDALRRVPGKDYVTLITCTPTGVNSHRLLVRGERIPTPVVDSTIANRAAVLDPGFPWWAAFLVGTVTGVVLLTLPLRNRTRGLPRHAHELE